MMTHPAAIAPRRPARRTARLALGATINMLGVAILVSQLLPLN